MRRLISSLLTAMVALTLLAPSAAAEPKNLGGLLGELWTKVLELPTPENPFAGGEPCIKLRGNIVAPLSAEGVPECTVKRGTKILFSGWTTECSTYEGNGQSEAELRRCAELADSEIRPSVTVNGAPVVLTSVETDLLEISLPEDNIFDIPPGNDEDLTGLSVAHGYEYLSKPLTSGSLTFVNNVTFSNGKTQEITTIITVA